MYSMYYNMYSMYEVSPGNMYLSFPRNPDGSCIPDLDIEQWIVNNISEPNWGTVNNHTVGIFLSHQDATAFKLRFGL